MFCAAFLNSAYGASPRPSHPTLTLDAPVYFLTADGSSIHLDPGSYQIEPAEEWLRIIPYKGTLHDSVLLEAHLGIHEEDLQESEVHAFLMEGEDLMHLVLLVPGGNVWETVGSVSGIWPRGGPPFVYQGRRGQTPFGFEGNLYGQLRVAPPQQEVPPQEPRDIEFQRDPRMPEEIAQIPTGPEGLLKQEGPGIKPIPPKGPGTTRVRPGKDIGSTPRMNPNQQEGLGLQGNKTRPRIFGEVGDDPVEILIQYRYFAGSVPDRKKRRFQNKGRGSASERAAKKMIAKARKGYDPAFAWWVHEINEGKNKCEDFKIKVENLEDNIENLQMVYGKRKGFGSRGRIKLRKEFLKRPAPLTKYSDQEAGRTSPNPEEWLVSRALLERKIRSPAPRTVYHLGIFKNVKINPDGVQGVGMVVLGRGVGALRPTPLGGGRTKKIGPRHEVGHYLGLRHNDGSFMTKVARNKVFGGGNRAPFLKPWCKKIRDYLEGK